MGFQAEVLHVLIASPSDVAKERDEIESKIFEWDKLYARELQVVLLPGRWEDGVTPTYRGENPQQIINEQLVDKCDLVIGVFWTKFGTPTEGYPSGTLEELDYFIRQGKEVMLYFVENDIPRNFDLSQVHKVDEYKREYGKKGIYAQYNAAKLSEHLYSKVMELKRKLKSANTNAPQSAPITPVHVVSATQLAQSASKVSVMEPEKETIILKLLNSKLLDTNDFLLFSFIIDTRTRDFGIRWMREETITAIRKWEVENLVTNILSESYDRTISIFLERGLLEVKESTSYGNPRLLSMPLDIYDELRLNKDPIPKLIQEAHNCI